MSGDAEWDNPHPNGATPHSASCAHPDMAPHTHTDANGAARPAAHCPSCGMEWVGGS